MLSFLVGWFLVLLVLTAVAGPVGGSQRQAITARQQAPLVADSTNCDGLGTFTCAGTATCYTDEGYIGCCSETFCLARTTCIGYTDAPTTTCDPNTDGCVTCTNSALPSCNYIENNHGDEGYYFYQYCDSTGTSRTTSQPFAVPIDSDDADDVTVATPTPSKTKSSVPSATSVFRGPAIPVPNSTVPDSKSSDNLKGGELAGIVVGCVAAGALLLGAIAYIARRQLKKKQAKSTPKSPGTGALGGNTDIVGNTQTGLGITNATVDGPRSSLRGSRNDETPRSKQVSFAPSPFTPGTTFTDSTNGTAPGFNGNGASLAAPSIRPVSPSPPELPTDTPPELPTNTDVRPSPPAATVWNFTNPAVPERNPDRPAHLRHHRASAISVPSMQQFAVPPVPPMPQFIPYRPNGNGTFNGNSAREHTSATGFTGEGTALRGSGWLSPEDAMATGYRESASSAGAQTPNVPPSLVPGNIGQTQTQEAQTKEGQTEEAQTKENEQGPHEIYEGREVGSESQCLETFKMSRDTSSSMTRNPMGKARHSAKGRAYDLRIQLSTNWRAAVEQLGR